MAKLSWYIKNLKPTHISEGEIVSDELGRFKISTPAMAHFSFEITKLGMIYLYAKSLGQLFLTVTTKKLYGCWEIVK